MSIAKGISIALSSLSIAAASKVALDHGAGSLLMKEGVKRVALQIVKIFATIILSLGVFRVLAEIKAYEDFFGKIASKEDDIHLLSSSVLPTAISSLIIQVVWNKLSGNPFLFKEVGYTFTQAYAQWCVLCLG